MNSGLKRLFAFALPAAFLLLAVHAQVPGVAIVTDLSGKASVHAGAGLTILSEIAAEARVDLAPGARLTALYFQSGDEYTFAGPA